MLQLGSARLCCCCSSRFRRLCHGARWSTSGCRVLRCGCESAQRRLEGPEKAPPPELPNILKAWQAPVRVGGTQRPQLNPGAAHPHPRPHACTPACTPARNSRTHARTRARTHARMARTHSRMARTHSRMARTPSLPNSPSPFAQPTPAQPTRPPAHACSPASPHPPTALYMPLIKTITVI